MSDLPATARSGPPWAAGVLAVVGLLVAAGAWLLPVNVASVRPAVLRAAGAGTSTLGGYGRDLVDGDRMGAAALVLAAARMVGDPRGPALAEALGRAAERQPGLVAWGGWDPVLDPIFQLRGAPARAGSTPVLTFLLPEAARERLRTRLAASGAEGVRAVLPLRDLTATGRFVPATRPGGQPLEALLLLTGLLFEGGHLPAPLQRELRTLIQDARARRDLAPIEPFLTDLLSLARRLDWGQLTDLLRRTDGTRTIGEFAHLARVAPDQLPLIYAAALFSDSADRAAAYLLTYGRAGLADLKLALTLGQGAVRQLLQRQVPVNRANGPEIGGLADVALAHPRALVALKYLGLLVGVWLLLRGVDRWLVATGRTPASPGSFLHLKSGVLALLFALLLILGSEPFLLRAAPASEFQLRLPVLVSISSSTATPPPPPPPTMDASTLLSIGVFAALQVAMYVACLVKIRDIARQPVPALVRLRLMENEENLFDGGLYLGIAGTATALVLQVLGVIEPNLLAAYSSNLFGITCVALVKIRHVRPCKRQLILEGQVESEASRPATGTAVS